MPGPPVVLRVGSIVAHMKDAAALNATLESMSSLHNVGQQQTTMALQVHEDALRTARHAGLLGTAGKIGHQLKVAWHGALARRLQASARSRGTAAHPDASVAGDIEETAAAIRSLLVEVFNLEALRDDCTLRRPKVVLPLGAVASGGTHLAACTDPEGVRPTGAVPPGGTFSSENSSYMERIASLEREITMVLQTQVAEGASLRREIDAMRCHRRELEEKAATLQAQVGDLSKEFDECFEAGEDDARVILRRDLDAMRRQVIHNGDTNNDKMDSIAGEFDQIREGFRLIYEDMGDLEGELADLSDADSHPDDMQAGALDLGALLQRMAQSLLMRSHNKVIDRFTEKVRLEALHNKAARSLSTLLHASASRRLPLPSYLQECSRITCRPQKQRKAERNGNASGSPQSTRGLLLRKFF